MNECLDFTLICGDHPKSMIYYSKTNLVPIHRLRIEGLVGLGGTRAKTFVGVVCTQNSQHRPTARST